jgi:peptidoglycan L-alanyl-D-glutamate endopeptidase CwlK
MRFDDLQLLAPVARAQFRALASSLALDTPFLPFETYRPPDTQEQCFARGVTKARAFESAHQYGLAVDFVPFINGNWRWDVEAGLWTLLTIRASEHMLLTPIEWDKPHVVHPAWKRVRSLTK